MFYIWSSTGDKTLIFSCNFNLFKVFWEMGRIVFPSVNDIRKILTAFSCFILEYSYQLPRKLVPFQYRLVISCISNWHRKIHINSGIIFSFLKNRKSNYFVVVIVCEVSIINNCLVESNVRWSQTDKRVIQPFISTNHGIYWALSVRQAFQRIWMMRWRVLFGICWAPMMFQGPI